jgi:hypothetical protein|tara:strand:- start:73 stop:1284 length:1212 start_codon:yes stop_codon:yes gene_type:complete
MSLAEDALTRIIEFCIGQISDIIENGEVGQCAISKRLCFFHIINVVPLTTLALYRTAIQHDSFEYLLFYERVRLGISHGNHFLDGVPAGVQLFSVIASMTNIIDVSKMRFRDIITDRLKTVVKLENMTIDTSRKQQLISTTHTDLQNVPGPVFVLVARCREMNHCLRRLKRDRLFTQCCNLNCNRLFYRGGASDALSSEKEAVVESDGDDSDSQDGNSNKYWRTVAGRVTILNSTSRFCSSSCSREHNIHLTSMIPISLNLDADDRAERIGRARVYQSLKLSLKRNELASRALRNARARNRKNFAVTSREVDMHRELHITALNIDIGVLYASSIIAESAVLSRNKLLPGSVLYWRDDPLFWAMAVSKVAKIYAKVRRKEGIVHSLLTLPRFLEVIQARAHTLF